MDENSNQSVKRKRRRRELLIIVLFQFASISLCALSLILRIGGSSGEEFLPIPMHASNAGDYSADANLYRFQKASLSLIKEVLLDRDPAAEDIAYRATAVANNLLTPVPTITPHFGDPSNSPFVTPTSNFRMPPTYTPLPTNYFDVAPTKPATDRPTQVATAKPTDISRNWPTNVPVPRSATPKPTKVPKNSAPGVDAPSSTPSATNTLNSTPTATALSTSTPEPAFTDTPTYSPTTGPTQSTTETSTGPPTAADTSTPTVTDIPASIPTIANPLNATQTPTSSPKEIDTPTSTLTAADPSTSTPAASATNTPTSTPIAAATNTPTLIATDTPTGAPTATNTPTASNTPTSTPIAAATNTPSPTATDTPVGAPTATNTSTATNTPTSTATPTPTSTFTPTPTANHTPTPTPDSPNCYAGIPPGFIPSDDAFIRASSPTSNFGSLSEIEVRPDNGANRRGLVRFDVSSIPQGSTVTSSTLYLYEKDKKLDQITYLFRLTSPWFEDSVTWNAPWIAAGGDFDNSHAYASFFPNQSSCMLEIDITDLVQEWVDGVPNYGLLLYSTGPNHVMRFSSKENAAIEEHPKLDITYLEPVLVSNRLNLQSISTQPRFVNRFR